MIEIKKNLTITFEKSTMCLSINDSTYSLPLETISKKLFAATEVERNMYKISPSGYGIHWPLIDEDLSVESLIATAK